MPVAFDPTELALGTRQAEMRLRHKRVRPDHRAAPGGPRNPLYAFHEVRIESWTKFVKNQMRLGGHDIPAPKLICIDLQPYTTTQSPDRDDILNIGGFGDAVFSVVAALLAEDSPNLTATSS